MQALFGAMVDYFDGERAQAWVWLAVGLAMAITAAVLRRGGPWRATRVPLAVFAVLQLGIGIWLLISSDRRLDTVRHLDLPADAAAFAGAELARMRAVATLFLGARLVEVALLVAGLAMVAARRRPTLRAVGLGVAIGAATMLALDTVAERRADRYLHALERAHVDGAF